MARSQASASPASANAGSFRARCIASSSTASSIAALLGGEHAELGRDALDDGLLGNFPQAISHAGLVNAALALTEAHSRLGAAA